MRTESVCGERERERVQSSSLGLGGGEVEMHHPGPVLVVQIPARDPTGDEEVRVEVQLLPDILGFVEVVGHGEQYLLFGVGRW